MGCCCIFSLRGIFTLLVIACIAIGFEVIVDDKKNFVFDQKNLQKIAQAGIAKAGPNATEAKVVMAVIDGVLAAYPRYAKYSGEWIFNNAGGAMGTMTVLHASFSEYLILFGSTTGTEGHTGRYLADDYFTIIYGEQWASTADGLTKEIYRVGDQHHLPRHVAKQYRMPDTCFALEYARGNIPSMLFFGFADLFTSTLDIVTLWQTIKGSTVLMIENAIQGKI